MPDNCQEIALPERSVSGSITLQSHARPAGYRHPLLVPLVALVPGCLAGYFLAMPVPLLFVAPFLILLVVLLPIRQRLLFTLVLALFWFSWGLTVISGRMVAFFQENNLAVFQGEQVVLEGVVAQRPVAVHGGQRFTVRSEQILSAGTWHAVDDLLLVTIATGQGTWLTGDRIRCRASIRLPQKLGLPNEFDYPRQLAVRGIRATAFVKDAEGVVLMRAAVTSPLRHRIDQLTLKSQALIRQSLADPVQRGVVLALATGDQHELPEAVAANYAKAGVSHILSVSGFHVGIVSAVWGAVLYWVLVRWEWLALRINIRRAAVLSTLPLMLLYLVFTGGAPATARSVVMLAAVVLALWSEREVNALDALLVAAIILLMHDPGVLFDLSFQLSFFALWGLLVLTPLLAKPFERFFSKPWQRAVLLLCSASLAAIIATLAPVLMVFHQVSFSGVLTNVLIVPLLGYGATVLATLGVSVGFALPALAGLLFQVAGLLVELSDLVINGAAQLPLFRSFSVGAIDLLATVVVLSVISFVRSTRIRSAAVVLVLLTVSVVHLWPDRPVADGRLQMIFLSVGHGDATLIRLPDGRTMLVDGGGYLHDTGKDFGERYLVPALHGLNVRQIDVMVLTHAHPDHLGGLPAVAEQFAVREFWQSCLVGQGETYTRLMTALRRQGTTLRCLQKGDLPLQTEDMSVRVLSPSAAVMDAAVEGNDMSLVMRLQLGTFSALLTGDAGIPVEDELVRQGLGTTTLLKVGHHGSRTATGDLLLTTIKPKLAIISVAASNRFGLPSPESLQRITTHGASVYRTDQQGSIKVISDGTGYTVTPLESEHRLTALCRGFVLTLGNLLR